MRSTPSAALLLLLAGGCHGHDGSRQGERRNDAVQISAADGGHVSVSIPGFGAKVSLPDMDLGKHMDLDGISLAPDTAVGNVDVVAHDRAGAGDGTVRISFTSPRPAAALIGWYRDQASKAGYGGVTATGDALLATKGGKRFALDISPRGAGSAGTITMQGTD